jgi:hypothetical protein
MQLSRQGTIEMLSLAGVDNYEFSILIQYACLDFL